MIGGIENRYPSGELFEQLNLRARSALKLIESSKEGSILVVTHSFFLHALLTTLLFDTDATFKEFKRICKVMKLSNTGITHCVFDPERVEGKRWKVITWNDDAHLGEMDHE